MNNEVTYSSQVTKKSAFFWLPLQAASDQWHRVWDALMQQDIWLKGKIDRRASFMEHIDYLSKHCPEIFTGQRGEVIDIGPGVGSLIEIARAMGNCAFGVDAPENCTSGMGRSYVSACELMWERQQLAVEQCGGEEYFNRSIREVNTFDQAVLINMRGSLEQAFHRHFDEKINRRSKPLSWIISDELMNSFKDMVVFAHQYLKPDGVFLIYANGSQNADEIDKILNGMASDMGFRIAVNEPRIHKWVK